LTRIVRTRDIIGQAKGILMERYDIDANAVSVLGETVARKQHKSRRDRTGTGGDRPPEHHPDS
jgi:ANTAR domain